MSYDPDKRKFLSALCHASIFISATVVSIAIPIAILLVSDDPVVKESAKESINFHLNVWVYAGIIGFLCAILIGWLLMPIIGPLFLLFNWIPPILAILKSLSNPNDSYRYPFIFRVV